MFAKSVLVGATVLCASIVEAHQYMVKPVPYDFNIQSFSNSPLLADGSDFPCRASSYSVVTENEMVIGEPQELAFVGTAVHGGGSCQVSITSDRAPTKDTKWSVIKSIEGGCVADTTGNLDGSSSTFANPYTFSFTIPDDVEPGQYTMAYTWFNRIGAREMYMDCAPITVKAGSNAKRSENATLTTRSLDNYPDMFVANINGCMTSEGVDIRYPCPGNTIEYLGQAANLAAKGAEACQGTATWGTAGYTCAAGSGSGSGTDSGSTPESSTTSEAVSTPTEEPTSSVSVGISVGVPVPDFTAAPEPTTLSVEPMPTSSVVESTAPAPTSAPSTSTEGVLSGPCTDEGLWNCIDGSSFQRCANGAWTVVQPVAPGTECVLGQTSDFTVKAIEIKSRMLKEKRSRRRSHGHVHA
ncbi:hypothetical protein BJX63DRAFT_285418 [Aspergillus granulosus]|uniref:Lytic polysaccharide monooxygenase n=1 Tax=Aspergillus granulosus TaxID=176169 RepID=A0ABR4H705_9EURO